VSCDLPGFSLCDKLNPGRYPLNKPNPKRMLRIAGGLFWLLVGVPRLLEPDPLWLIPWLCFGAGYLWVTVPRPVPARPPASLVLAAAVQAAAALVLLRHSGTGLHAVLLTILAGTLPAL